MEALLAFIGIIAVGYAFTWVSAFAGLSLKTIEAVQAALFTIVFPFVFLSTAFVPLATFPSWLQPFVEWNPADLGRHDPQAHPRRLPLLARDEPAAVRRREAARRAHVALGGLVRLLPRGLLVPRRAVLPQDVPALLAFSPSPRCR